MSNQQSNLSSSQKEIKAYCDRLGIKELLHFTRCSKMPYVLRYGLLTQSILSNANAHTEDSFRWDNNSDHVCASIDFPNYKLFYLRRQERPIESWCVLSLPRSIIWEYSCLFFPSNAASGGGRQGERGICGLQNMYRQSCDSVERSKMISSSHTTNPQAEVLIPAIVPSKLIQKIYLANNQDLTQYESIARNAGKPITVRADLFQARADFEQWQSRQ
jgi:hypothetical protein